jgi:hypothetical protein
MGNKKFQTMRLAQKRRRTQRTWLVLGMVGILLVGAAFLMLRGGKKTQSLASVTVYGAANLKADQEQIDLGNQTLGNSVQVSFHLTNAGDQPLRFLKQPYVEVVEGC